jgi:Na+-translocating ferredoxin:NAD+ oxidoreductase subunit C
MKQQENDEPLTLPPSTVPTMSRLRMPAKLFVPVPAGGDVPAKATRVKRGQAIASGALAPAAGVLGDVTDVQLLDGGKSRAMELHVEGADEVEQLPAEPPRDLPMLLERLRGAGVTASRRTSPDLLAQLAATISHPVDLLICNLLDVDAGSSLHAKVIRESGDAVISGVVALARALSVKQTFIATEETLANRASVLVRKAGTNGKMKVAELVNDYPQSDPTLLVYALSGRRLKPQDLPTAVKTLLLDGPAAVAVGRALTANEPMLAVPIEVRDSTRARSHVVMAAVGTPLRFVMESMGLRDLYTLRAGAALRDIRVAPDAIVSGAGELSIDAGLISAPINPDPCIRSGWCVENCPVRIHPAGLLEAAQDDDMTLAEHHGLHACIECGICSYVCPSRLPLLDSIRELRSRHGKGIAR